MNYEPLHQILSGLGMVGDDVDIITKDHAHQLIDNEEIEQLNTEELENLIADVLEKQTTEPKQITQKPFVPCIEPSINIVEEPGDTRFRFMTEGRGTLNGLNSSKENRTYPTIQIKGFKGPAKILVSCVEDSAPYRVHPHQVIGKGDCSDGICILGVHTSEEPIMLNNLGIARVKVKDITKSLALREKQTIDPFNQGFDRKSNGKNINLHQVRLCFQAYLGTKETGFTVLTPVLSRIIRNKEPNSDLQISNYSDNTSPVKGGKKIMVFCGRVHKEDIEVHFEIPIKGGDKIVMKGIFSGDDVHKHCAIAFKTPPFIDQGITQPFKVEMILHKPSDKTSSDPIDFWYLPEPSDIDHLKPNIQKIEKSSEQDNKKRPMQRCLDRDESTGQIYIPPIRAKKEYDEKFEKSQCYIRRQQAKIRKIFRIFVHIQFEIFFYRSN